LNNATAIIMTVSSRFEAMNVLKRSQVSFSVIHQGNVEISHDAPGEGGRRRFTQTVRIPSYRERGLWSNRHI